MKVHDIITEGGSGSGREHSNDRPTKNLWFQNRKHWLADLHDSRGANFDLVVTQDTEKGDIFATDKDHTECYGVWRNMDDKGITFYKPVPMSNVVKPSQKLKPAQQILPKILEQ